MTEEWQGYVEVNLGADSYTWGGDLSSVEWSGHDKVTLTFDKVEHGVPARSAPPPLKVVVPTLTGEESVAHLTLIAEGVEHTCINMVTETSYGELLKRLWVEGESFFIVEHDIAPFPGALAAMADCHSWWCARSYHLSPTKFRPAFGLVRFHRELLAAHPTLWKRWDDEHWMTLDATVYRVLQETTRLHVHEPGVAHVKRDMSPFQGSRA